MKKILAALALTTVIFTVPAQAEFKLDSRYSDADGDMIADIPTDASQLSDPDTLVFAYTPVETLLSMLMSGKAFWIISLRRLERKSSFSLFRKMPHRSRQCVPDVCMFQALTLAPIRLQSLALGSVHSQ